MLVIAEIGLNHNGSEERAWGLLESLCSTKVDGITFQIREQEFYDHSHPRKYELSDDFYKKASSYANKHNKIIGIAISDKEKVPFLNKNVTSFWKTLSWDLDNLNLQQKLQATCKTVYASTGLSSMQEIVGVSNQLEDIVLIHTQLNYLLENVNLKAMSTIRANTGKKVAYGLHSEHHEILYMALSFLPAAIFFYVKDLTGQEHPDDDHAIPVDRVELLTERLNCLSNCVGDGAKVAQSNTLHPDDDMVTHNS